eukprot:scaffold5_cov331-Pavlova_lutheri.AAC.90
MSAHEYEYVAVFVGQQPLGVGHGWIVPSREDSEEGFDRHFCTTIVHFDLVPVQAMSSASMSTIWLSGMPSRFTVRYMDSTLAECR